MNIFLVIVLLIISFDLILNLIIELLNLRHIELEVPEEFKDLYEKSAYEKSQQYLKEKTLFSLIELVFGKIVLIVFILLGGFNILDLYVRGFALPPLLTAFIFTVFIVLITSLLNIPFAYYDNFIIEDKFGFNRSSKKTFFLDILKGWLVLLLLAAPVYIAVVYVLDVFPDIGWIICWLILSLFQFLMFYLYPIVILPMFNKFVPIEDQSLKALISGYAFKQGIQIKGIYQIDGSRRSTKANAYFTGLGRYKIIALYDTLIAQLTNAELLSVVAHEAGHYKLKHLEKRIMLTAVSSALMLFVMRAFIYNPLFFDAFKMDHIAVYSGLYFFGIIYMPIKILTSLFTKSFFRKHEYDADHFAVDTTALSEEYISALKTITINNMQDLSPHPLKIIFQYSHPPVLMRIKKIKNQFFS